MIQKLRYKARNCFHNQKQRCYTKTNPRYKDNGAKGITVEYTREQFIEWFISNYPKEEGQWSVGRIDHSKGYSLSNIKFETVADNSLERIKRVGTTKPRRKIMIHDCISGEDVFIAESANEAATLTGIDKAHVRKYCLGYCKRSARGFTLRYLDETGLDIKNKYKQRPKREILIIDYATGKVLDKAFGTTDAAKKTGVLREHVGKYCDGKLKRSKGGLTFKWA